MMQLVRICAENWHAVERDLLSLSWAWNRAEKEFRHIITGTEMSLWQLVSVVVSSPPGTAVYHAETRHNHLTPEAQMLAALGGINAGPGQNGPAGASSYPPPRPQPKVDSFAALPDYGGVKLTALPVNEFVSAREKLAEAARERARAGKGSDKVVNDKYNPFKKTGNEFVVAEPVAPELVSVGAE